MSPEPYVDTLSEILFSRVGHIAAWLAGVIAAISGAVVVDLLSGARQRRRVARNVGAHLRRLRNRDRKFASGTKPSAGVPATPGLKVAPNSPTVTSAFSAAMAEIGHLDEGVQGILIAIEELLPRFQEWWDQGTRDGGNQAFRDKYDQELDVLLNAIDQALLNLRIEKTHPLCRWLVRLWVNKKLLPPVLERAQALSTKGADDP